MTQQPSQPQYDVSNLYLFPVYSTRAYYQTATGQQAPPYDATKPIKQWADPSPSGAPYLFVDPAAQATDFLNQVTIPAALASLVNLPGAYSYPAAVYPPTDAQQMGPFGPVGTVSPDQVCMQADAQEIASEIASLVGVAPTVAQYNNNTYHYVYGQDPRRQWWITFGNYSLLAQALIELKIYHGIGSPGHWTWDGKGGLNWVYDAPVIAAPAGATVTPIPVRALLSNEKLILIPPAMPTSQAQIMVERTDLAQTPAPQETSDQQFADLKAGLAAIQDALSAVRAKLGA